METERQVRNATIRRQRLAQGGGEAASERDGTVRGQNYTYWPDTVRFLKRQKRDGEALDLLLECIAAAELDAPFWGGPPPPWYTENAAIILRRNGDTDGEIRILERYAEHVPPDSRNPLQDRLDRCRRS